eukprot:8189304-Ditylum_brightwellii.AAC.1
MFKDSCDKAHQIYSYCGVVTHHQNGIAEAMDKRLSQGTRTIFTCQEKVARHHYIHPMDFLLQMW